MMQLMVYAVVCPLLHGFCALGKLGKVRPHAQPRLCVYQIVDQSITVICHDKDLLSQINVWLGCPCWHKFRSGHGATTYP